MRITFAESIQNCQTLVNGQIPREHSHRLAANLIGHLSGQPPGGLASLK